MPGLVVIEDDFVGLANNATISGRVAPISESSSAYGVDPASTAAVGGGSNDVKFSGAGVAVKFTPLSMDRAIQILVNMNGADETFGLFTRDGQSTPYPRNGIYAGFSPNKNGIGNGVVSIGISNNYSVSYITGFNAAAWTYSATGINTLALESIGDNHRVVINNVQVTTFVNSTYSNATSNKRMGMTYHSAGTPSTMRLDKLTVFDSIIIPQSVSYVSVTVS